MIRRINAFAVALIAASAVAVSFAGAAQATNGTLTTSNAGPAHIDGEQLGAHHFTFTDHLIGGSPATGSCTTVKVTSTPNEPAQNNATTVTLAPTFEGCTFFGLAATVNTSTCHYLLHFTTTSALGGFNGDLTLPNTCTITIVTATCEVQIHGHQLLENGIEVTNSGGAGATEMDLLLHMRIQNMIYTVTKDGIGCPLTGTGTFNKGDLSGTTTLTGTNPQNGTKLGLTLHHLP